MYSKILTLMYIIYISDTHKLLHCASPKLASMFLPVLRYIPVTVISVPPATCPSVGLNPDIMGS